MLSMEQHGRAGDEDSTANRFETELRNIHHELLKEIKEHFKDDGGSVDRFSILAKHLSLVRTQGSLVTCGFIQAVACTEMIFRICGRSVHGLDRFYFDPQECFDHIFTKCDQLRYEVDSAKERQRNTMGQLGTEATRYKIHGHEELARDRVLQVLNRFPVIAVVRSYPSLDECRGAVYKGPDDADIVEFKNRPLFHSVLLVGRFWLNTEKGKKEFVIMQNCTGLDYGFKGLTSIEVGNKLNHELFDGFWIPILKPQMNHLTQNKRGYPMVGSKRKKSPSREDDGGRFSCLSRKSN